MYIDWIEAERIAAAWMRRLGWKDAELTAAGSDGGIDVRATGVVAQVKAEAKPVGRPVVQQLAGAARGKHALLFSTSGFTAEATEWADANGIGLFRILASKEGTQVQALNLTAYRSGRSARKLARARTSGHSFAPFVTAHHEPPGRWDSDPFRHHQLRWWNGQTWTAWVADDGEVARDTNPLPPPATPLRLPARAPEIEAAVRRARGGSPEITNSLVIAAQGHGGWTGHVDVVCWVIDPWHAKYLAYRSVATDKWSAPTTRLAVGETPEAVVARLLYDQMGFRVPQVPLVVDHVRMVPASGSEVRWILAYKFTADPTGPLPLGRQAQWMQRP